MNKLNLKLNTITPIWNFSEFEQHTIVRKDGCLFFVDNKRLDKLLSLTMNLFKFNEYYNSLKYKDITCCLKRKGLYSDELLNEISFYKLECGFVEEISAVYKFFQGCNDYYDLHSLKKYIYDFLMKAFRNILLYEYFEKNNLKLNTYVQDLLTFFANGNQKALPKSLNLFMQTILELDKQRIDLAIKQFDIVKIHNENDFHLLTEYFCIEKIAASNKNIYQECFKAGLNLSIEIQTPNRNFLFDNLEKYAMLIKEMTQKRMQLMKSEAGVFPFPTKHDNNLTIANANFCFLSPSQIFYLNLSDKNRDNLNKMLRQFYCESFEKEIIYFDCKNENELKFFNYAKLSLH